MSERPPVEHRVGIVSVIWVLAVFSLLVPTSRGQAEPNAKVDALFKKWARPDSPGCALGVIKDGDWVYRRGYGVASLEHGVPISSKTVFYIGSTSKQFVAASVVLAAHQGHLSLDDDIRKHFPELPDYGTPITVRHLVHHTSGLRDYLTLAGLAGISFDDVHSDDEVLQLIFRQRGLNAKPGERHLYSNSGYFLLAELVKRTTGQSLRSFARSNIFGPLGMAHTHFHDDRHMVVKQRAAAYAGRAGAYRVNWSLNFDKVGSGGLLTSVDDLLQWDRNFYKNRLAMKGLVKQLLTRGKLNDGTTINYAFGLAHGTYRGLDTVSHGGAFMGFRAQILRFPSARFTVIVLCNLATMNPTGLAVRVADIYLAEEMGPRAARTGSETTPRSKPAKPSLTAAQLAAYAGVYISDELPATYRVEVRGGRLRIQALRQDGRRFKRGRLRLRTADRFRGPGCELRFTRDAAGKPDGFALGAGRAQGVRFRRSQAAR